MNSPFVLRTLMDRPCKSEPTIHSVLPIPNLFPRQKDMQIESRSDAFLAGGQVGSHGLFQKIGDQDEAVISG